MKTKSIGLICLLLSFGLVQQVNAACMGYEDTYTSSQVLQYTTGHPWYFNYSTGDCPSLNYGSGCGWGGCEKVQTDNVTYIGLRDGFLQSKSGGRNQAAWAQLDACFSGGSSVSDTVSTLAGCYDMCDNSSYNVACASNAPNALGDCWTRCDAINYSNPR